MRYELLLNEAALYVDVYEKPMQPRNKGLYMNGTIWVNRNLGSVEKTCILAEELGHYHTSSGNILDQTSLENRKQEMRARAWANDKLIPLDQFVMAGYAGVSGRHDIAEWLEVTEVFLQESIEHYQRKHGLYAMSGGYLIFFEPLSITKM